ncbi:MAG: hypothetical protein AAFU69_09625, partial [Pseudomonadota bacterium]
FRSSMQVITGILGLKEFVAIRGMKIRKSCPWVLVKSCAFSVWAGQRNSLFLNKLLPHLGHIPNFAA